MSQQRKCSNCNADLKEGALFCTDCGTKVIASEPVLQEENYREEVFCTNCGSKILEGNAFCVDCGTPINGGDKEVILVQDEKHAKQENEKEKKKQSRSPIFLALTAFVLIAVIAVVAVVSLTGMNSVGANIIYGKDGELNFEFLPQKKSFELTERLMRSDTAELDEFSDFESYILTDSNNRYLYYPDRTDNDSVSYYWRDLKANNTKEDAAVKIDSDIKVNSLGLNVPVLTSDGSKFFYCKGEEKRLYVYDRKTGEKNKLDDGVGVYYVNHKGDYIIYNRMTDGEYTIYEMSLKGLEAEKTKIDSDAWIHMANPETGKMIYTKNGILYSKEGKEDKEKIASNIEQVLSIIDETSIYYLRKEEVVNRLQDFIADDLLASDQNAVSPQEPVSKPEPDYPSYSDFDIVTWEPSGWGYEYNEETEEWGYWNHTYDYDAFEEAEQKYEKEYDDWKSEENRNWEEYRKLYVEYQEIELRNELRDALASQENAITYDKYSLYYWNKGEETKVAENLVSNTYSYTIGQSNMIPVVIYQKYSSSEGGKQKLSELLASYNDYYYVGDVVWDLGNNITSYQKASEEVFVASGDRESVLEADEGYGWRIQEDGTIYFLDEYDFNRGYGRLMRAVISGGVVSKPEKIDEDVSVYFLGNGNQNLYYFKDVSKESGDLYMGGKKIASDVYTSGLYQYEGSDNLLYYTAYNSRQYNATLCLYQGGKEIRISDDVSDYVAVDEKNIAYLRDYSNKKEKGELMLYHGKSKSDLLCSDVSEILWNPAMRWWMTGKSKLYENAYEDTSAEW